MHIVDRQRFLNAITNIEYSENPNLTELELAVSYCNILIRTDPYDMEAFSIRKEIILKINKLSET